jgi:hypothetical protein
MALEISLQSFVGRRFTFPTYAPRPDHDHRSKYSRSIIADCAVGIDEIARKIHKLYMFAPIKVIKTDNTSTLSFPRRRESIEPWKNQTPNGFLPTRE